MFENKMVHLGWYFWEIFMLMLCMMTVLLCLAFYLNLYVVHFSFVQTSMSLCNTEDIIAPGWAVLSSSCVLTFNSLWIYGLPCYAKNFLFLLYMEVEVFGWWEICCHFSDLKARSENQTSWYSLCLSSSNPVLVYSGTRERENEAVTVPEKILWQVMW